MTRRLALAALLALPCGAQDFTHFQIEKVIGGFAYTDGPVWSRDGYLAFSDIPADRILHIPHAAEGAEAHASLWRSDSGGANGNTFDAQGRLYTCEGHTRRVTRTDKKGKVEVLAAEWQGKRLNAPNDIVVRRDGQVYFTDPAFGSAMDTRELDFYGVFHITPKGELSLAARWKTRPNGVALSPDGAVLYVADSDRRRVERFDLDRAGNATAERPFAEGIAGVPNGLKVDERGNLYVAANGVSVYSPEGKRLGEIPFGETPSNCAFGDDDLGTLYVTAQSSVYRTRLGVKGSVQY